jgi:hypothetical protein
MAMGLRPLDISRWLEIDEHRSAQLDLKRRLLEESRDVVVATRPEADAASAELLEEIRRWFATFAPDLEVNSTAEHPIVTAARVVQEDLCVLLRDDAWRLQAACVCFPSRWSLASKIGRTMDQIHAPIPGYGELLSVPTNAAFDRLKAERPFWRLNWTLIDDASLHQPTSPRPLRGGSLGRDDLDLEDLDHDDLDHWFFRVERQTIRRLPSSGAIVFTIHNYVASLEQLRGTPEFFEHLQLGIDTTPAPMQEYKGWVGVARRLREILN